MKLDDVRGLLPDIIQTIARLIGMPNTIKLVEQLGGTTLPISKNKNRLGEIRYAMLAEVIGVPAADLITSHFGGIPLYIANCEVALRRLRDLEIVATFDGLSREIGSNAAVAQLAREYKLSDRRVWEILKNTDTQPDEQLDLFGKE